jgi:hypothetical protein
VLRTFESAENKEHLRQLSVVNLGLSALLCDIAKGKDTLPTLLSSVCRQDPAREKDGSADAKSLH